MYMILLTYVIACCVTRHFSFAGKTLVECLPVIVISQDNDYETLLVTLVTYKLTYQQI